MYKKYSYLWNFFVIKDSASSKAICFICSQVLSYKTSITNLKKHLQNKHPELQIHRTSVVTTDDVAEILNKTTEDISVKTEQTKVGVKRVSDARNDSSIVKLQKLEVDYPLARKMSYNTKKSIDHHLITLFTKDFHKFSIVEDSGFQSFVTALNPQYHIPDIKTIAGTLFPELYERLKERVEDSVQDGLSVTLSVEFWLSYHNEPFISIKAHFLDQNFDVMTVLLDCYAFTETPSIEKVDDVLKNVACEWGIDHKISLVVYNTDNVFEYSGKQLQWDNISCIIHKISSIVTGEFRQVGELLIKVKCIVLSYKKNKFATTELLKNQENLGIVPEDLILSNMTDWYSVFKMLQRFVELEDFVKTTINHLDISTTLLTKEEWLICREFVEVIKPFEVFIKSLCEEKFITTSVAVILSKGLETMLKDLSQKPFSKVIHSILMKYIEDMNNQLNYIYNNNILLISTFLDPRFKDVIFEQNIKDNLKQTVTDMVSSVLLSKSQLNISKSEECEVKDESVSIWKAFHSKASESRPCIKKDSRASIEIQQYIEEGLLPRNENPMQWWKINGHMYPHLKNLLKQNFAVTCIAVPRDYLFSEHLKTLNERRAHLSIEEAKFILFINCNDYII